MADNSTGLAVKSLDTETVRIQIVDTGGTNEAAVSAAGRLSVDASGVAIPLAAGANNIGDVDVLSVVPGVTATSLGKAEDVGHTTGDTGVMVLAVRNDGGAVLADTTGDYIPFTTDATGALRVTGGGGGTEYIGDGLATATPTGSIGMGLAHAAAPADVSADNDAVASWFLRNGAQVVNLASGGTLWTNMGQTAATGQFARVTDGTTTAGVIVGTTALKTDLSSIAGTAPGATAFVPSRLTDGTAYYTRTGQTQAAAPYSIISDGTTIATVRDLASGDALNVAIVDGTGAHITSFGGGTQYAGDGLATATPTGTIGMGLANAAAPADVSANNDAVAQWMLRNGSAVTNLASGGTLITIGAKTSAASLPVVLASDQAALAVTGTFWQATQPVSAAALPLPTGAATETTLAAASGKLPATLGAKTSAASLSVVLASDHAPQAVTGTFWQATQPVSGTVTANAGTGPFPVSDNAGTLTVDAPVGTPVYVRLSDGAANLIGQKAMAASLPVVVASDQSVLPANITQIGGAVQSQTNPLSIRLTNGTAFLANLGETAATGTFMRITDATNTAGVIATINALKTDFSSVAGAVPSATNPVPVRLTDGAAFYASASGAPVSPQYSTTTSADLGAGGSVDLDHTLILNGTTGQLTGVDVSAAVPLKVEIKTVNAAGTPTTRVVLFTPTHTNIMWRTPYKTYVTQAGAAANARFRVTVTNRDTSTASNVYSTAYWDQV